MKIKEARLKKGFTLQELANEIGCSLSYLHRIENSERKTFNYKIYQQLVQLLDLPVYEINHSEETMDELEQLLLSSEETKLKLQSALDAANQSISKIVEDLNTLEKSIENSLFKIT